MWGNMRGRHEVARHPSVTHVPGTTISIGRLRDPFSPDMSSFLHNHVANGKDVGCL